jgi:hypothetical protein
MLRRVVVLLLPLGLAACGSPPSKSGAPAETGGDTDSGAGEVDGGGSEDGGALPLPIGEDGLVDCEAAGLPCSPDEVGPDAAARVTELSDRVLAELAAGRSPVEVRAWLEAEPDVLDVLGGLEDRDTAVAFLVADAVTHVVLRPGAERPAAAAPPALRVPTRVLAEGEPDKTALLVSPYIMDFGDGDDSYVVEPLVAATPDYEAGLTVHRNTEGTTEVVAEDFRDVSPVQLYHLSTHGAVVCRQPDQCVTVFYMGRYDLDGGGDELRPITGATSRSNDYIMPLARWAGWHESLEDTFVFLSACESARQSDGTSALQAQGAEVLGWTDVVQAPAAQAAAARFYEETLVNGRRVGDAHAAVVEDGLDINIFTDSDGIPRDARLVSTVGAGEGPRLRETVEFTDEDHRRVDDRLHLEALTPQGDGEADRVELHLRLFGVEELEAGDHTVELSLDGVAFDTFTTWGNGSLERDFVYLLEGETTLPVDTVPGQLYTLRAEVSLPEGGTSVHEVEVQLGAPQVVFESELSVELADVGVSVTQSVAATIELEWDGEAEEWSGTGDLDWVDYSPYLPGLPPECTLGSPVLGSSTARVVSLALTPEQLAARELPAVLHFFPEELDATVSMTCSGVPLSLPDTAWYGAFLAHRHDDGSFSGTSSFIELTGFTAGTGDVVAEWTGTGTTSDGSSTLATRSTLRLELSSE